MFLRLLFIAFLLTTMNVYSQPSPPIETGVSQTLAKWRAAHYSDVRYKLNITLEKRAPLLKGEIEIRVSLTDAGAKNDLILDWRTTQFAGDKEKPYANAVAVNNVIDVTSTVSKEHLIVPKGALKTGENVIKIQFASPIKTSGAAVTRYVDKEDGAEYVYSLFVPSDASTTFPVFDQPDLKARFSLTVNAPKDWKVISNSDGESFIEHHNVLDVGDGSNYKGGTFYLTKFAETKPISTYVFAFAAGEFATFVEGVDYTKKAEPCKDYPQSPCDVLPPGVTLTDLVARNSNRENVSIVYVRKSQAEKFRPHAKEVFRLNREAVKYLETYFDYKFPFPKYDLVLIPEFPFGGMEHAGATFLREASIIFPSEPTANDYISRANLIFHEAAHQWFGDTVTMRWFDDLWLKEGFAEFMAYKTLEKVLPEYNAWKAFYERNKPLAYLTDVTQGTTPIYQPIPNLSAAKSAYGNIVYRKAPSFLRQAEFYLGEKEFQRAVRAFLKKYQFSNAEWTDLVRELESASGKDLKFWAETWVKRRGVIKIRPYYSELLDKRNGIAAPTGKYLLNAGMKTDFSENGNLSVKFKALIINKDGSRIIEEMENSPVGAESTIIFNQLTKEPAAVFPNYQDYGYGIFLLDEKSREYVLKNIQNEKDPFLRSMMWGSLWDSVREAELAPKEYVELAVKNLLTETDELTIQTILNRVSTAMNYYLSDKQRDELAPKVEALLLGGMLRAKTNGQKVTFFRAYLNLAASADAQRMLGKILQSGGKPIELETFGSVIGEMPQLELPPLKTKDKFDIVARLLILENRRILGKNDAELLLAELEKTETSDDAKRYAYAARAGTGRAENKAKYWNDFVNNREISESWIEAAFVPFNSVRHSEVTLPYLEKALAELPNLKRSRKIFFVNGWLAAFIGGQKDEKALAVVNKFLADNPDLDRDLRLKILENVDALERAVRIRSKYGK